MIESNIDPEEAELETLRAEGRKREEGYRKALAPLLKDLSPTSSAEALERAAETIAKAITKYRLALQAAPRDSLKARRAELRKTKAALEACLAAINQGGQSLASRASFRLEMLRTSGSQRELRKQLKCAIRAAEAVLTGLNRSHHHGDSNTAELSAEITMQMRSLGLRPVASSDATLKLTPGKSAKAAGLARLLRTAMKQAGARPPEDLRHYMKKGFELARTKGVLTARRTEPNSDVHVIDLQKFDPK